jgi:hypothetical protein
VSHSGSGGLGWASIAPKTTIARGRVLADRAVGATALEDPLHGAVDLVMHREGFRSITEGPPWSGSTSSFCWAIAASMKRRSASLAVMPLAFRPPAR